MTTTRYATAAALGCVYAALAVWLVGAEGRSYRESLRRQRVRASQGAKPTAGMMVSPTPPTSPVPPVATAREAPRRQPTTKRPDQDRAPAPTASSLDSPAANVEPKPADTPPLVAANVRPTPAPAERSPEAIWADSLDLTRLSSEDEARLGAELHRLVLASNPVDRDGDLQRLKRAAAPLLERVSRKEVEYRFTMLDSDEVNAFSLPGGYIFVSRGLFHLVGETTAPEEDFALQFVLGHEIAHVDLRHALTLITPGRNAAMAKGIDTLAQLMVPISLGFPDAQEFAADSWAYQQMTTQLNRTRRESLMFLIKLQGFSERNGFRNGRGLPEPSSGRTLAENHY